ncbi:AMP-dependent synthetase [Sulfolobales archaeon HS-7]|nr:AMP-dependent synthetase [Sulfolobales archaeon HS-7]
MNLPQVFNEHASNMPEKTFLLNSKLTYARSREIIGSMASSLGENDVVVFFMQNSELAILNYIAILWAGAKVVAVDPQTSSEDLRFILEDSLPTIVLADDELRQRERKYLEGYNVMSSLRSGNYRRPTDTEDEIGLIYYYAGIAGKTMQVLHRHKSLHLNAKSLANSYALPNITTVLGIPLAHVLGNSILGVVMESGGSMYVMSKFEPGLMESIINKYSINMLSAVPLIYDMLYEKAAALPSLELCLSAAAPLSMRTVENFYLKFGKPIVQQYGFTEGLVLTFQPISEWKKISIGYPLKEVEIKLLDVNEKGEGELAVRAPWLMAGYKDYEETRKVYVGEFLRTGDIVSLDEKGLIYFKGVKKRMIKYKGYPIFPRDLEEILLKHPLVEDAVVYGQDAGPLGQEPVAEVKVKQYAPGLETELLEYVNSKVAFYKRLKTVRIVS